MRGSTLLAMLTALLFLIGITLVTAGVIVQMFTIQTGLEAIGHGSKQTYTLTVRGVHLPTLYQDVLMVSLDSFENGIYIKEALANASLNKACVDKDKNEKIWHDKTCQDVFSALQNNIAGKIGDKTFLLVWQVEGKSRVWSAGGGIMSEKSNINKVAYTVLPNTNCKLILYVVER